MFTEALEWRHKDTMFRVESDKILPTEQLREVDTKVSEIAKVLKEGAK